ncbi:MAG: energy transducer TonB [Woeseiaceae bacterium]|nr:energy transducer TonB [Woeseiaceae bacterium]
MIAAIPLVCCSAAPAADASDEQGERSSERAAADIRFVIRDSSTERTPAKTAFPAYPRVARRDRIEGDATVCFKIDAEGKIRSIRVKNYSHRIFRRPALKAIRSSSFEPLKPHEVLKTARTCRTYRFRLEPIVPESDESSG